MIYWSFFEYSTASIFLWNFDPGWPYVREEYWTHDPGAYPDLIGEVPLGYNRGYFFSRNNPHPPHTK